MNKRKFEIIRTSLAIGIAFVILLFAILFISEDPVTALHSVFLAPLSSLRNFGNVIELMIPLMFTGLALSLIFSGNNFNLASEGAFLAGGIVVMIVALGSSMPTFVTWIIIFVLAGVIGSIIVGVPGFLKIRTGASELVSSIMLNSIILYVGIYILNRWFRDVDINGIASLAYPKELLFTPIIEGTRIHFGLILAIIAVIGIYLLMYKTKFGYKIRMTGKNGDYAKVVGINVTITALFTQFAGGAIAAIGGAVQALALYTRFVWNITPGFGWDGVIVAILARNNPKYVPLAAFFYAYLKTGANIMARRSDVPAELISIVQGIIILLIVARKLTARLEYRSLLKQLDLQEEKPALKEEVSN